MISCHVTSLVAPFLLLPEVVLQCVYMFSFPSALSLCRDVFRRWLETSNNATNLKFLFLRKFCLFYVLLIIFCRRTEKFYCPGVLPTPPLPPPNDSYARILTHLITLFGVFRKLPANFGELKKKDNFFLLSVAAVSSYIP